MVGYSKRSLAEKLGIKPHGCVVVLNKPPQYEELVAPLPVGTTITEALFKDSAFIHFFVTEKSVLEKRFAKLKKHLKEDGILWISWPKGSSKIPTDLNENSIRDIGLAHGLVDVKVCDVDEDWSGLKFVYRLVDRKN